MTMTKLILLWIVVIVVFVITLYLIPGASADKLRYVVVKQVWREGKVGNLTTMRCTEPLPIAECDRAAHRELLADPGASVVCVVESEDWVAELNRGH